MTALKLGVFLVALFLGGALHSLSYAAEVLHSPGHAVTAVGAGRPGGTYRVPLLNNPKTLDPAFVLDIYGETVIQQLFDGLVKFSPDLFIVPGLAESWRVEENGNAYRFVLRKDAKFHNGRTITAKDVIFTLSRLLRLNPPPSILPHLLKIVGARDYRESRSGEVKGIQTVDDHTLLISLEEPYVPFLVALGMYQAKILPAREMAGREREFAAKPMGTGPFRFVSWQDNELIRLERFPEYYGGRAFLDGIDFLIYPGGQIEVVYDAFIKGDLHEMPAHGKVRQPLKERKDLKWIHRPSLSLLFYGVNCRHPVLGRLELRRALSLSIDREKLVSLVYGDQFEPANSILPPGLPGYQPRGARGHV